MKTVTHIKKPPFLSLTSYLFIWFMLLAFIPTGLVVWVIYEGLLFHNINVQSLLIGFDPHVQQAFLALFLTGLGLVIGIAFFQSRRLSRPVDDLIKYANSLKEGGESNSHVEMKGCQQFRPLVDVFNQLSVLNQQKQV